MKPLFTIAILFLVVGYCSAQASATTDAPVSAKGTAVKFDSMAVNFGTLTIGDTLKKIVTFTNTGKRELIFSGCNCAAKSVFVKCPSESIRPGQSGSIKIQYIAGKAGKFKERIDISNNAVNGAVTLVLKGNVVAKMETANSVK